MVKHDSSGRWIKFIGGGGLLICVAFVGTMWANTRELVKEVPVCQAQITQNTKDNARQDTDIEVLKTEFKNINENLSEIKDMIKELKDEKK